MARGRIFRASAGNQLGGRESHLSPALGQRLLGALAPAVAHTCLSLPVGLTLQPLQIHLGLANPEGRGGGAEQEKDTGEKGKTEAQWDLASPPVLGLHPDAQF